MVDTCFYITLIKYFTLEIFQELSPSVNISCDFYMPRDRYEWCVEKYIISGKMNRGKNKELLQ